jgi:hypothetical protein
MRGSLLLILLSACAWVTDDELDGYQEGCECSDGGHLSYRDADGDGFGNPDVSTTCPEGDGWVSDADDCDDDDPEIHPGATERCNGADDDCDGDTDGSDAVDLTRWYQDADGDGWGDAEVWTSACEAPSGYVGEDQASDCDDSRDDVHPGGFEICGDLLDNDCDGDPGSCRLEGERAWGSSALRIQGLLEGDGTGSALVGGADLTGDHQPDLVIGVDSDAQGALHGGAAYVFAGPFDEGPLDLDDNHALLLGTVEDLHAGSSLALLGDLQADGRQWLAVGCQPSPDGSLGGVVYLLPSPIAAVSMGLSANAEIELGLGEPGDAFGQALAGGLDATGNGHPDVAIGAPGRDSSAGEVLFFEGPLSKWTTREQAMGVIAGEPDVHLGARVVMLPDVDGDGLADLMVGSTGTDAEPRGAAHLFLSPLDTAFTEANAEEIYQGYELGDLLAGTGGLAAAGDVDGDGRGDMLLGAPLSGEGREGSVYLLLGSTYPVASLDGAVATITGTTAGSNLGYSVAGLEDFDADGRSDLLLGAPGEDDPGTEAGCSYLFYGAVSGALQSSDADAWFRGASEGALSGLHLVAGGDLNADGYSDALIGAPSSDPGEVALFPGQGW